MDLDTLRHRPISVEPQNAPIVLAQTERNLVSFDSETTGIDFHHGSRPYFVTICNGEGDLTWWEWNVDPLTREPQIPDGDLQEIAAAIAGKKVVLQNAKFDVAAIGTLFPTLASEWDWSATYDTLLAGHLLASNQPHDLTSMALHYLGVDIQPYEDRLEDAVKWCRRRVQQAKLRLRRGKPKKGKKNDPVLYPEDNPLIEWRIADEEDPDMPSVKGSTWKVDGWLPRAFRKAGFANSGDSDHPEFDTVLADYSNADSGITIALWQALHAEIKRRGLVELYEERRKILPIIYRMERQGITLSAKRLDELSEQYKEESAERAQVCLGIAEDMEFDLKLPKSGRSGSLDTFSFDVLKLPVVRTTKKRGAPSLDRAALEAYVASLDPRSPQFYFVRALAEKRQRDTALAYMEGYCRFMLPLGEDGDYYVIHPWLNPCGTDTLRCSSTNPNEQNISKRKGFNLRYVFGPVLGREWWAFDGQNLELRFPAYEAGEEEMIGLFERPNDPPYYGSNHLLNFSTVYPEIWEKELLLVGEEKVGPQCKDKYKDTWYQYCKNGGFAVQYGAIEKDGGTGTADRAFHRAGAHALLKNRFRRIHGPGGLNERCIKFAEKYGYIETMPDKRLGTGHGYPLLCTRTDRGKILPTVPLNYRVQGTACWWMQSGMIRVREQLDNWWQKDRFDGYIAINVHDELDLDFPARGDPRADFEREKKGLPISGKWATSNLWRARVVQKLMALGGDDVGVPTPVSCTWHEKNWSEGVEL